MKINKRFISSLYFFKISALLAIILFISTIFIYKPMKSVSNFTGPNSLLGSMVENLNLTGNDDSSYETNNFYNISTNEIFKYIMKYSNYLDVWEARGLAKLIKKECKKYNINPYLILAIIKVESGFNPSAVSARGAVGLMQIMPDTAFYLANKKGASIENEMSLQDPLFNVQLGIYYFNSLIKRYGDIESALFAYNYGPGKFEVLASNAKVVPAYVRKVMKFKDHLEDKGVTKES